MNFYSKYARLCTLKGLSPSRVAAKLGISKNAVSNWKKGGRPTPENLIKIADYFGVPVSYFDSDKPIMPEFNLQLFDENNASPQEKALLETFRNLDEIGKAKLLVYASELLQG